MSDGFDNLLNATGKVLETFPGAYTDVVQPAAKESGKTLSLIPRTINAALIPLQCWIANREYRLAETEKLLAKKLENIDSDKIVTPDPYVAVPAIQAISYSMDSDELRNLYANLLAKSMNLDTKDNVHPSYVETIKQLSPSDAAYFKHIVSLPTRPIVEIRLKFADSSGAYPLINNCNLFSDMFIKTYNLSIDNLSRLGLINIPMGSWYSSEYIYTPLIDTLKQIHTIEMYKDRFPNANSFDFRKQRIDITEYGRSFFNICIQ